MFGLPAGNRKAEASAEAATQAAERDRIEQRLSAIRAACRRARSCGEIGNGRGGRREGVYKVASATFVPDQDTSCRVVDQSGAGFRLAFHEIEPIPEEFALTVPTIQFIGIVRKVWQNGAEVGVSIVRLPDAA